MVLSDRAIRRLIDAGRIAIDPYDPALMQPASLDVRVDRLFRVFRNSRYPYIDVKREQEGLTELVEIEGRRAVHPPPGRVRARLDARAGHAARRPRRRGWRASARSGGSGSSSTRRRASSTRVGTATSRSSCRMSRTSDHDLPGMKIGQISFLQMTTPADQPYGSGGLGSKYQGQRGPTPSRYCENFEDTDMILVTGAHQASSAVTSCGRSAKAGEQVRALVRDARGAAALDDVECEIARGDITDAHVPRVPRSRDAPGSFTSWRSSRASPPTSTA